MRETVCATVIPAGVVQHGRLKLSLVISPRLSGAAHLGSFPDFLHWTERLAASPPKLAVRCGANVIEATIDQTPLRPDLWGKIFDKSTRVQDFQFNDRRANLVISYRTRNAAAAIKNLYQVMTVSSPAEPVQNEVLLGQLFGFSPIRNVDVPISVDQFVRDLRVNLFRRQKFTGAGADPALDPEGSSASLLDTTTVNAIVSEYMLYQRMPPALNRPPLPTTEEDFSRLIDFHKALTALSSYPALERALGLVVDATIPSKQMPNAVVGLIRVEHFEPGGGWQRTPRVLSPSVFYRFERDVKLVPTVFAATDAETDGPPVIVDGFLGLDPARYQLITVDLDGAMIKVPGLAEMMSDAFPRATAEGTLPALRSGGISLAADDRAGEVLRTIATSGALNDAITGQATDPQPLRARDLVKGYRIDVWSSDTSQWYSLHQRAAEYRLGADGVLDVTEEGFTQLAVASPAPDPKRDSQQDAPGLGPVDSDLYVHERLARWAGWSLSARKPGTPLNRDADAKRALDDDPTQDQPLTPFKMTSQFSPVAGSLPRLRFGTHYRFRVRVTDLAGNSPAPDPNELSAPSDANFPVVIPPTPVGISYLRWEPIPHPAVLLHGLPEGTRPALNRLVIRSHNSDPSLDATPTAEVDDRHIAPARASVDLSERHGFLDGPAGMKGDAATFAMVVARNDGNFATTSVGTPPTNTPFEPRDQATIPYLPDPIARSAAFRKLPGVAPGSVGRVGASGLKFDPLDPDAGAGPVVLVSFGPDWPDRQPFRLQLAEGAGPPQWDGTSRVLTTFLPKSLSVTSALSSAPDDDDLALMGLWAWQREYLEALNLQAISVGGDNLAQVLEEYAHAGGVLTRLTLEGGQWAITPSLPLKLVHAVQQPIGHPSFSCVPLPPGTRVDRRINPARDVDPLCPISARRSIDSPDAMLIGGLQCHYDSTSRIDLVASWLDGEDSGSKGLVFTNRSSPVETLSLAGAPFGEIMSQAHAGDSVALFVTPEALLWFAPEREDPDGHQDPSAPIHRLGDTRHRQVTYQAISTSRFQDDFPSDQGLVFTRSSEPLVVEVPNSSRPPTPRIRYVVPTFGWRRHHGGSIQTSVREGRGLRVYLERPWFMTGEDEQLGVVLWNGTDAPSNDDRETLYKHVFTMWGLDPIRASGPLAAMPGISDFPDATTSASELRLLESDRAVDVAGHAVHFDKDRGLWYADLSFKADTAYAPFVRLALARFQPHSIPDVELSAITLADFAQLTPDRSAILIGNPAAPTLFTLIVSGLAPRLTPVSPLPPQILVTVERRRAGLSGDLAWEPASASFAVVSELIDSTNAPAALWAGTVEFAAPPRPGESRIVIREYEYFRVDPFVPIIFEGIHLDPSKLALAVSPAPVSATSDVPITSLNEQTKRFPFSQDGRRRLQRLIFGPRYSGRLVYAEVLPSMPGQAEIDGNGSTKGGGGSDGGTVGGPAPGSIDATPVWPPFGGHPPFLAPDWTSLPTLDEVSDPSLVDGNVKLLQAMLNVAVAPTTPLVIDGNFGTLTASLARDFRVNAGLPDQTGIDTPAWLALAFAAPFPLLEPGLKDPPMTGPPVAVVQRLLNVVMGPSPIAEDGIYTPETAARVSDFQSSRGLIQTAVVDLSTWAAISEILEDTEAVGTLRFTIDFDRARLQGGGPALIFSEGTPIDASPPATDPLAEDWTGRSGFWVEIQDVNGRPLFRRILGSPLNLAVEVPADPTTNLLVGRPGEPPTNATIDVTVPKIPAGRVLAVFGATEGDAGQPAELLGSINL